MSHHLMCVWCGVMPQSKPCQLAPRAHYQASRDAHIPQTPLSSRSQNLTNSRPVPLSSCTRLASQRASEQTQPTPVSLNTPIARNGISTLRITQFGCLCSAPHEPTAEKIRPNARTCARGYVRVSPSQLSPLAPPSPQASRCSTLPPGRCFRGPSPHPPRRQALSSPAPPAPSRPTSGRRRFTPRR
jgi:hypothetical protein